MYTPYHIFLTHLSVGGHLGCLNFPDLVKGVRVNKAEQVPVELECGHLSRIIRFLLGF